MSDHAETPPPANEPDQIRIKQTERGLEVQTPDGFNFIATPGTDLTCPNGMNFVVEESDIEPYHVVHGQFERLFELNEALLTEYGSLVADQEDFQREMLMQAIRIQMLEAQKLRLEKATKKRTGLCSLRGVLIVVFALLIIGAFVSEDGRKGPSVREH